METVEDQRKISSGENNSSFHPVINKNVQINVYNSNVNIHDGDIVSLKEENPDDNAPEQRFDDNSALAEVRRRMRLTEETSLENNILFFNEHDIPVVHPRMLNVSFYEKRTSKMESYYPSNKNHQSIHDFKNKGEVKFEDILGPMFRSKFVGIVGFPGSGKTTLSKRLARHNHLLCFYLQFRNINYSSDYKLSLQELLLDNMYPELDKDICEKAFRWIVNNDSECAIIIDGYDQSEWLMEKIPPKVSIYTKLSINNLVANLCLKRFLSKSTIIITSRPHGMISLPVELRPQNTILLHDYELDVTKQLFFAFAGLKAETLWNQLTKSTPQLLSFCQNPLMLLFVLKACLKSSNTFQSLSTMTSIFTNVLEDLRYSSHSRHDDIHKIVMQIARIAYKRTDCHSVVIRSKDLQIENLTTADVQDLIIALFDGKRGNGKIFDGDTKLFFSHQTLQEYFAALYVAKEMPLDEFKSFVYSDFFKPHWDVVRRFVCGLLGQNDETEPEKKSSNLWKRISKTISAQNKSSDETYIKRSHLNSKFEKRLKSQMEQLENEAELILEVRRANSLYERRWEKYVALCGDIIEFKSQALVEIAAKYCPKYLVFLSTMNDNYAVAKILQHVEKKLEEVIFSFTEMTDQDLVFFINAIKKMPGSIEMLKLSHNKFSSRIVEMVAEILPKVERINMNKCIRSDSGSSSRHLNEEENQILLDELNKLGDKKKTILVHMDKVVILAAKIK